MKKMLKDAMILLIITIIAGGILGAVHTITKAPIEEQKAKAKLEAFEMVFSTADTFNLYEGFTTENAASVLAKSDYQNQEITEVNEAKSQDGTLLGYILTVVTKNGYAGNISFTMGITLDGTLNGISLLSISETPGLGMKAEEILVPQFTNKKASVFSYTKTGAAIDSQIDAISGATITTNAITEGVNAGIFYYQFLIEGGVTNE